MTGMVVLVFMSLIITVRVVLVFISSLVTCIVLPVYNTYNDRYGCTCVYVTF